MLRARNGAECSTVSSYDLAMRTPGARLRAGGDPVDTIVVCGAFVVGEPDHPALRAIPRIIHVPGDRGRPPPWVAPSSGLAGQILELLRYRGLLERFEAASTNPSPARRFPFGGVDLDFTQLADPPLHAIQIPQPRLERVLDERAREVGADIRRGHEVVELSQDDATVTADVLGPDGPYRVTAGYLVGCDGPRSRVRDQVGISFPGTTYPEVHRLGEVTLPDSVTRLENGDLEIAGVGRIPAGFTRSDRGVFGLGALTSEVLMVYTSADDSGEYDDDEPMTRTELQNSVRRVLGKELPMAEANRLSRFTFHARQAERYRDGRVLLAGDAAHLFPATGIALNAGMLDSVNLAWKLAADLQGWAPADLLDTYHDERQLAGARTLLHTRAQVALRRGQDPAADALREVFLELLVDEQPLRRMGAMVAGTDIRYPAPGPGQHPLTGTFAPDLTLHTDQGTTSIAELMHDARPVLIVLADRPELRETALDWQHRIPIHTAKTEDRPADALLIRPDCRIAWAPTVDEPIDTAAPALQAALSKWFGSGQS